MTLADTLGLISTAALDRGDYDGAVRVLSQTIASGELSTTKTEQVHVLRARAYLGKHLNSPMLADLDFAQRLKPGDPEVISLRTQLQARRQKIPQVNYRDNTQKHLRSRRQPRWALAILQT